MAREETYPNEDHGQRQGEHDREERIPTEHQQSSAALPLPIGDPPQRVNAQPKKRKTSRMKCLIMTTCFYAVLFVIVFVRMEIPSGGVVDLQTPNSQVGTRFKNLTKSIDAILAENNQVGTRFENLTKSIDAILAENNQPGSRTDEMVKTMNATIQEMSKIIRKHKLEIDQLRTELTDKSETITSLENFSKEMKNLIYQDGKDILCYMGMKDGNIADSAITASSRVSTSYYAYYGRLDIRPPLTPTGCWAPYYSRIGQWIQVDLGQPKLVAGLVTQGRSDADQWVQSYKVYCGTTVGNLATITENDAGKVFTANTDRDTKVTNKFQQPMTCRYIRVYPQTWHGYMSMRLELIRGSCWDLY